MKGFGQTDYQGDDTTKQTYVTELGCRVLLEEYRLCSYWDEYSIFLPGSSLNRDFSSCVQVVIFEYGRA